MSVASAFLSFDRRFLPWSFLGFLIGAVGLAYGLYAGIRERKPAIAFDIVSEANVLDVHRPLQDLAVIFRGEDLDRKGLNLKVLVIRVQNTGDAGVRQNDYDQNDDWGFRMEGAKIANLTIADARSDYLKTHVLPEQIGDNQVRFRKVILDSGDYFVVEVLAIYPRDRVPDLSPFGKIAGMGPILVIRSAQTGATPSYWRRVLDGSIDVHLVRAFAYLLLLVALALLLGLFTGAWASVTERRQRARRRRAADVLRRRRTNPARNMAISIYVKFGIDMIRLLRRASDDHRLLQLILRRRIRPMSLRADDGRQMIVHSDRRGIIVHRLEGRIMHPAERLARAEIEKLAETGALTSGGADGPAFSSEFVETLDELLGLDTAVSSRDAGSVSRLAPKPGQG